MSLSSSPETDRGVRIFLVEDHLDTLTFLKMFLTLLGHTVQTARTMKDALSDISDANCDILISDIGLPDGSGHEILRRMKVTRPVYAIAISGYGTEADIAKSKAAGFRHHLVKPFGAADLTQFLDEAIGERVLRGRSSLREGESINESNPAISTVGAPLEEENEIATLAYRLYDEEGRPDGKAEEHWLRAEQEVRGRTNIHHRFT